MAFITSFQLGWDLLNQCVAFQPGFVSVPLGPQLQAGDHSFFSESAPTCSPICTRDIGTFSHSHSAPSHSGSKPRGLYKTKKRVGLKTFFTETVREFAKPLFTIAMWKAELFFIEANWSDNNMSKNKILDLCLQETYGTAVSRFKAEHHNSIVIVMKMKNSYSLKALREKVHGHFIISYCLS